MKRYVLIAGVNGAGKSTFYYSQRSKFDHIPPHRTFEERLAEYDGKISVYDFNWGEPEGRELL